MISGGPGERRQLAGRVGTGVLLGALYASLDAYLDVRLMSGAGTRFQWIAALHEVVDFVLPVITGAAMGLSVHYLRLRADAVAAERRRAEELRGHLHKIERDQAVWVVAASLLHELRNPLHALGLLLDELTALPPAAEGERAALLDRARAQHDRITAELGALKALPASETPELPRVDVAALVVRLVAELASLTRDEPARVVVRAPAPVEAGADPTYVQIIVENLVENALDALRERGGAGVVDVEVTRADGGARVRVRDDGPGIEPEAAATIFEPLHTTKARGMGLGLSIARALARAMGGDLALERPRPATFLLTLQGPR
jgi:signal transduction histidine kinase